MASHDYYDHLNKPLPPQLTASPAPYESGPSRQDSLASSHYSQRGNTIPVGAHFPARQGTGSSVPPLPQSSVYTGPPSYTSEQNPGAQVPAHNASHAPNASASPFDTVFDDNAYPYKQNSSQQTLMREDSSYRGASNMSPSDENLQSQNAIPLQDRNAKDPIDDNDHVYEAPRRRKSKKKGIAFGELGMLNSYGKKKIPWVVYIFSIAQIGVFIGEIVDNAMKTGSPIMIHPSFNYLIGPSTYVMIHFGARFVPCMHNVDGITDSTEVISWPCPSTTSSNSSTYTCTLSDLCGFGGIPEPKYDSTASMSDKPEPNQWWRFIIPMFMHAGLIHIGFNLLLQLTMGKEIEILIGSIRFFLVYVSAAIFGFVLGGNYASTGSASTGASGGLFGIIGLRLLDLFFSWSDRISPVKDLMFIMLDIVISLVLGLLPGVDNFSHIGGLLMGLALGLSVLHSPNALRRRIGEEPAYTADMEDAYQRDTPPGFFKNPVGFFKGRKPLWWAWWLIRAGMLLLVFVVFIVLLNNFYVYRNTCSWCKYLSCLPVKDWCDDGLTVTSSNTSSNTSSKRDVLEAMAKMAHIPREFFV